jgi:hypothetical protein
MASAWTCSYQREEFCILLKKPCIPGIKGCTLSQKGTFATTPEFQHEEEVKSSRYNNKDENSRKRS